VKSKGNLFAGIPMPVSRTVKRNITSASLSESRPTRTTTPPWCVNNGGEMFSRFIDEFAKQFIIEIHIWIHVNSPIPLFH
jgi:hypothetical protein